MAKPLIIAPHVTYAMARQIRDKIQADADAAGARLRAIPGVGSGQLGLTPDAVKSTREYQSARAAWESAFATLRAFNAEYCQRFKREIRAERDAMRADRSARQA